MILTTPRLTLRPLQLSDANDFFELNNDPEVLKYVPDKAFANEAAALEFLANYHKTQPEGYGRMAVIRQSDNAWLGWCGLKYLKENDQVDLGYRFFRKYWGNGYATEGSIACLKYGFEDLGLDRIVGHVAVGNVASARVLEKCGFTENGLFEEVDWSGIAYLLERSRYERLQY